MSDRPKELSQFVSPDSLRQYLRMMKRFYELHTPKNKGSEDSNGVHYAGTIENFGSELLFETHQLQSKQPPIGYLNISDAIKQLSFEICQKHYITIKYMETDKDHIHYMIETEPTMSVSKAVNLMKSYTTYHIWEMYPTFLSKHFWKEHTFWTDGYFACSVGNVSEETLRKYIENQG